MTHSHLPNLWHDEYSRKGIPSSFRDEPSGSVVDFLAYLSERGIHHGIGLDLGCGSGRNSLYLASHGFQMHSIDFVSDTIATLRRQIDADGLSGTARAYCQSVTTPWPLDTSSADFAIDTFCYKHQIRQEDRAAYRSELRRVLKPGGNYLLTLAGTDDGYYGPLLNRSPDPEQRIIIDPANNIPSVLYSREDVESEFDGLISFDTYSHKLKTGMMHGAPYLRSTHVFFGHIR